MTDNETPKTDDADYGADSIKVLKLSLIHI